MRVAVSVGNIDAGVTKDKPDHWLFRRYIQKRLLLPQSLGISQRLLRIQWNGS